ncbi:MAG TPA: CAP domain-containing protein [Tepidisphaeraceae bacterium]|jgi:hypothetical protein|nr:CAP domain-containing protein [Tepidisphaeraceae bacterium]
MRNAFFIAAISGFCLAGLAAPAFGGDTPTDYEQYVLQLINRARANPNNEVTRLSGMTWGDDPALVPGTAYPQPQTPSLNEGLPVGTISSAAKPPLAFNTDLIQAARDYSNTLLSNNQNLTHTYNGTSPTSRDQADGYNGQAGENLALTESSASLPIGTGVAESLHNNLFIDNNTPGRGHRLNLMDSTSGYREIGIGLGSSSTYAASGSLPNAVLMTEDFGVPASNNNPILLGVVFNDVAKTNFYAPGEGLGGVTILATPVIAGTPQSTTTWSSGGYSLQLAPGTYIITATGPFGTVGLGDETLATDNVELDVVNPAPEPGVIGLFAIGAMGLLARRRRNCAKA